MEKLRDRILSTLGAVLVIAIVAPVALNQLIVSSDSMPEDAGVLVCFDPEYPFYRSVLSTNWSDFEDGAYVRLFSPATFGEARASGLRPHPSDKEMGLFGDPSVGIVVKHLRRRGVLPSRRLWFSIVEGKPVWNDGSPFTAEDEQRLAEVFVPQDPFLALRGAAPQADRNAGVDTDKSP